MRPGQKLMLKKWGLYALALLALASVFSAYLRPDFLVSLADQLWSCF